MVSKILKTEEAIANMSYEGAAENITVTATDISTTHFTSVRWRRTGDTPTFCSG